MSSPNEDLEQWLVSEAHARDIPLPIAEAAIWVRHAKEATVQRALQTLQTWLRLARQQQETGSTYRCELPELLSARTSPILGDGTRLGDLALAEKTVKDCDRATTIGGQAVLCRRIGYANLYRLNQRARKQSVQAWGFREILFHRCYPEFGYCSDLQHLKGAARSALGRLTRDIHFGGSICRFLDRSPTPEAVLLLQPTIPDKFLRRLTATQMQLWADLVYRSSTLTSATLGYLWKATTLVMNHDVVPQSLIFPLEQVRFDGLRYVDLTTNQPFDGSIEDLLRPVSIPPHPFPLVSLNVRGGEGRNNYILAENVKCGPSRSERSYPIGGGSIEECQRHLGERDSVSCDLPSTAYGGRSFWQMNDDFSHAVSAVQHIA